MPPTVAVVAAGAMGAGVGARLTQNGVRVLTSLTGRSAESAKRAAAAGMADAADTALAQADFFLSIVPPGDALPLAERMAPALQAAARKPLYVDCNAVSPETVRRIAAVVMETGCGFADGGIIGSPPRAGYSPSLYVSGADAARAEALSAFGLRIRPMEGAVGDASALKMCYGSLTKGFTAIGSASALAAERAGVSAALRAELAASQPQLFAFLDRSVPTMFSKAYRWVAEMEEIAHFFGEDAERGTYEGIAALYERLAQDHAGAHEEIDVLAKFFAPASPPKSS
jgi:putative dehydrogenase